MINKLIISASIAVSTLFVGCTTPNNNDVIKPNVSLTNIYFKALILNGAKAEIFENVGSTKMMCPNMKTEDNFSKVLQHTKTYEIKGETLNFFDEKGQKISTFEAVYF